MQGLLLTTTPHALRRDVIAVLAPCVPDEQTGGLQFSLSEQRAFDGAGQQLVVDYLALVLPNPFNFGDMVSLETVRAVPAASALTRITAILTVTDGTTAALTVTLVVYV